MKNFYFLAVTGMFLISGLGACNSKSSDKSSTTEETVMEGEDLNFDVTEDSNGNSVGSGFVEISDNPSDINVKLSSLLRDHITIKSLQVDGTWDVTSYQPGINLVIELKEPFDFDDVFEPRPQLLAITLDSSGKKIQEFGTADWYSWNVGWKDMLEFCQGEPGDILSVRMTPDKRFENEEEMNENLAKIKEFDINLKKQY